MTAAYKAAKAWFDANPGNIYFKPSYDRQRFVDDMTRRLSGHLEQFFKAEVERVAGPLTEALRLSDIAFDESESESCRFNARVLISTILDNYRKEMSK